MRPTTPLDPTLASRPVPRKKAFPIRSFGPGNAIDTSDGDPKRWQRDTRSAWWKNFYRAAVPCEYDEHENLSVLRAIEGSEAVLWRDDDFLVPQPTWGYYVFLTDYDQATMENIPRAMENWVEVIQRHQGANATPPDPYAEEAFRRFKLDLIYEQESLASASIDRVRECFRALIRSLEITDGNDADDEWVPPTRNKICLVLDAAKIQMLANLTFRDGCDYIEEYRVFETCRVQAVDIKWQRPEETMSKYRGVRDMSIADLAWMNSFGDLEEYYE